MILQAAEAAMEANPGKILLVAFAAAFLIAAIAALVTTVEWTPVTVAQLIKSVH